MHEMQEIHGDIPAWQQQPAAVEWLKQSKACDLYFSYEPENIRRLKHSFLENGPLWIIRTALLLTVCAAFLLKKQGIALSIPPIYIYMYLALLAYGMFFFPAYWRRKLLNTPSLWITVREDGWGVHPEKAQEIIARHTGGKQIDWIVQPIETRRKKLLITDMDSTMITGECIDELADFVGKKAEVAAITERAMNGELDFAEALTERVALLRGLPEAVLQQCYDERVKMMPGGRELVARMRAEGAQCVLVSGGFTFFTQRVAAELGFHEHYANVLEVQDGKLTGRVVPPILGKEAKLAVLQRKVAELGITPEDVLAVGDGANDLPMLLAAGLGVAYHAKPVVQAQAKHRINHCDLSALLYAQGYK